MLEVGQNAILRASNFVQIEGGFTVPVGASLYLDASKNCSVDLPFKCSEDFRPIFSDFDEYDNRIRRSILMYPSQTELMVMSASQDLEFSATDFIELRPGVTVSPFDERRIILQIKSCE